MNLRELILKEKQPDMMQAFTDFLPLAMKELSISKLPRIKLSQHLPDDSQPAFGRFVSSEGTIYLGIGNRHPMDTLRTLAHELVHFKQFTQKELNGQSGNTGSPAENEAHATAGVIMRNFGKKFPGYFSSGAFSID